MNGRNDGRTDTKTGRERERETHTHTQPDRKSDRQINNSQIAISIICRDEDDTTPPKRKKYSDGITSRDKDDGINRRLLVAISPGTTENHDVLTNYLSEMNIKAGKK